MLHLGNINFKDNDSSIAEVNGEDFPQQSLEHAAELLQVNSKQLKTVLLERHIIKKEDITMYVKQCSATMPYIIFK